MILKYASNQGRANSVTDDSQHEEIPEKSSKRFKEFQELLQIFRETNRLWSWEFVQPSLALKLFPRENVLQSKRA